MRSVTDMTSMWQIGWLADLLSSWDRTPQVTALAQLMMDPQSRTMAGFAILIEKDFVSFGHKFAERYGHGDDRADAHDKQRSPIFIQWMDCVYQVCGYLIHRCIRPYYITMLFIAIYAF
jgi:hypothetical protein